MHAESLLQASRPAASIAVVLSLLVMTGINTWQALDRAAEPAAASVPFVVNVTMPERAPPAQPPSPAPSAKPAEPSPEPVAEPPKVVQEIEAPKYRIAVNFTAELFVSSTPLVYTPWTGEGPPILLVYYDGLQDVGMLHHAYVYLSEYVGYDLCSQRGLRFTDWTALYQDPPSSRTVYQSTPLPQNPYNLLGSGENCYTRLTIQSVWHVNVCMEGDGRLLPMREETRPDGVQVQHVDYMDYCFAKVVETG